MTSERLREAIRAHSPDDEGEARVIAAARRTLNGGANGIYCRSAMRCILRVAWRAYAVAPALFADWHGRETPHGYEDVIKWFDRFVPASDSTDDDFSIRKPPRPVRRAGNHAAAREVLRLLGAKNA